MTTPIWTASDLREWTTNAADGGVTAYAFYRSDWNAIITDPRWMSVPVDDHLVHRGDGVFETLLCEEGAVYNLEAHLTRLRSSARAIRLDLPWDDSELRKKILDSFRASERERSQARVLVGRGPGGFSVDPAESRGASLYIIVYPAKPPFMESHPQGARLITSSIPPKSGGLATVKTCNYLPNALSKLEAGEAGADFAIGIDARGYITESATENLAALREEGVLIVPPATEHLAGTTLARVAELMQAEGWTIETSPLRPEQLFSLPETFIIGTTAYVTQAVELDGRPLPTGPQAARWMQKLQQDVRGNAKMRSVVRRSLP